MPGYADNVFLNCPLDDDYRNLKDAILFAIFDCGFVPRCAQEISDSGEVRFEKIQRLIADSKYAIHDISRTELDCSTGLPRFNMPLELGVFLGAKHFGSNQHRQKNCLILDRERYRYQSFISDIAGHDIRSHDGQEKKAIQEVRDWLNASSRRLSIPGGAAIANRYDSFRKDLPKACSTADIREEELTYNDYLNFVSEWLRQAS